MKNFVRIILALLTAALAPATVLGLAALDEGFAFDTRLIAFTIALAHAVVLGLPAYFCLRELRLMHWWMSIISGFTIGAVPFAIFSWPVKHSDY